MRSKKCTGCGIVKFVSEFHKSKSEVWGVRARCKLCIKAQCAEIYKENIRQKRFSNKRSHYRTSYGITLEDVDTLRKQQKGRCLICRRKEKDLNHILRVDHCHETGRVRGLLCHNCNCGLGHLRDDPKLLERAIIYLRGEL